MATNSLFHSRCNPIDMRSFIRSYFLATLANTSFTALRGTARRGGVGQLGEQMAVGNCMSSRVSLLDLTMVKCIPTLAVYVAHCLMCYILVKTSHMGMQAFSAYKKH